MNRPPIVRLRLVCSRPGDREPAVQRIALEHPSVAVLRATHPGAIDVIIDASAWLAATDFRAFDEAVERADGDSITVRGESSEVELVGLQVLTRWQRHIHRRNAASATSLFDAVLRAHAALHDTTKPLVKGDLDHAIDTWCWMLRLAPDATLEAQLAALFHDVENLESASDRRGEREEPDYAAFRDRHAARGAQMARDVLLNAGVAPGVAEDVRRIIAVRERRVQDAAVSLLNDADGLSFFSLGSAGYADHFGPEQTRKKVAYALAHLGSAARARLDGVRLRPDIAEHLRQVELA